MDDLNRWGEAAQGGDRNALGLLLGAMQTEVWRYCANVVGTQDADDAAQEALLRVVASIKAFDTAVPVRVWVMSVVRNACTDWSHQSSRHRALADRVRQQAADRRRHDHGWSDTADLLADLDADRREAFVLTQVLGFSYEFAAEICSCAVGTIRSRVARARIDLLRAIDAAETDTPSGRSSRTGTDGPRQGRS